MPHSSTFALIIAFTISAPTLAQQTRLLPPDPQIEHDVYETTVDFLDPAGKGQTGWTIRWQIAKNATFLKRVENLVLRQVYFKTWPKGDPIQVLERAELNETTVAYSKGPRFYDVGNSEGVLIPAVASDLGPFGKKVDPEGKVVAELRDRGLLWKARNDSRRGQELVLWATLRASNYFYIVEYRFQDDGTIAFRLGSTGHNLSKDRNHTHVHAGFWRLDVALGGNAPNLISTVRHIETQAGKGLAEGVIDPISNEGGFDWNDKEFTTWRVTNPKMRNRAGNPIAYDLLPFRAGTARHWGPTAKEKMEDPELPDEAFSRHDFWVTPFDKGQSDYVALPKYVEKKRTLGDKTDVVLWYQSSAHHWPRDEDLIGPVNQREPAATTVVWSGFDFRPRDVMASTPFFSWPK